MKQLQKFGILKVELKEENNETIEKKALNESRLKQTVQIGTKLCAETKRNLLKFFKERQLRFTWDVSSIPSIVLEVITHKLNVDHEFKPIKQKRRKLFQ